MRKSGISRRRIKPPDIPREDYDALLALYDMTNGKHWDYNANWGALLPASSWYGVVVKDGRVIEIKLPNNNIIGDITGWQMPEKLQKLVIPHNPKLTGNISDLKLPLFFQELDISYTNLRGDITNWGHPLPIYLSRFHITKSSLTGDVSNWIIPATLVGIKLDQTSMYGSLKKWKLPECIRDINLSFTGLEDKPRVIGGALTRAKIREFNLENRVPFRYNPDD